MDSYFDKTFIYKNRILFSIIIFIILLSIIHSIKPPFIYNPDGSFMDFGVGYANKTVLPIWVIVIIIAIFSYISVLYFLFHYVK